MYLSIILFTLFTSGFCYVVPVADYSGIEATPLYRNRRSTGVINPIDEVIVDEFYDHYNNQEEDVAHIRHVRDVFGSFLPGNPGAVATVGARGNLFSDNLNSLNGHAQLSRNFFPSGPPTVGGGLQFQTPQSSMSVGVSHAGPLGTALGATLERNIYKGRNDNLNAYGSVTQHFGGPGPRTPPYFNVGLKYNYN